MRLWTLHPKYLDAMGLVALWREGLLAKAVLEGKTRGYRKHPQLTRFREQVDPLIFLCEYLRKVLAEADHRGYHFNGDKLPSKKEKVQPVAESKGQLEYEWQHLLNKLARRDKKRFMELLPMKEPEPHPLFHIIDGGVKSWERIMQEFIEPKKFGLPSRTVLEQLDAHTIAIIIQRKTRIIMADGRKILDKAERIKKIQQDVTVVLKTTAPVCSKTFTFLEEEGVQIIPAGQ